MGLDLSEQLLDYSDKISRRQKQLISKLNSGIFLCLLVGFLLVFYQIVFPKEAYVHDFTNHAIRQVPKILMILFLSKWGLKVLAKRGYLLFDRKYLSDLVIFGLLFIFNVSKRWGIEIFNTEWFLYITISLFFIIRFVAVSSGIKDSLINPSILFTLSFVLIILGGTATLLIPDATHGNLKVVDSLFTTTSAVCVTGLSTVDVPTKFTYLGKTLLLGLIQVGGLGLMTFTYFFTIMFRGGISLRNHVILSNLIESDKPTSLFSILVKILTYTFFLEFFGAILIYIFTIPQHGSLPEGPWFFAFFHSISAFCNAGFSTAANGLFNDGLRFNYNFINVISLLIVLGGIGFPVVIDIYQSSKLYFKSFLRKIFFNERLVFQARNLTIHSKIVLTATGSLLLFGGIVFYFLERNNTLAPHSSIYGLFSQSFFGSVTPRTAGFNTVDMGVLMQGTVLIYILLMWIGAAPSSTGGGIKVTTFVLAFANVFALARGKERVEMFKREISQSSIGRAFMVIWLSLMIIGLGVFFISIFDPKLPLSSIVFECFSAYSTVGLSLNMTPLISDGSKIVLVILMFLGRVGMFTILFGLFKKVDCGGYRYPKDSVQVM